MKFIKYEKEFKEADDRFAKLYNKLKLEKNQPLVEKLQNSGIEGVGIGAKLLYGKSIKRISKIIGLLFLAEVDMFRYRTRQILSKKNKKDMEIYNEHICSCVFVPSFQYDLIWTEESLIGEVGFNWKVLGGSRIILK